jgi:hypothetical protein
MPLSTEGVIHNHFAAARVGVDAILSDYTDASVLVTPEGTYRGLADLRRFFTALLDGLPAGFFEAFRMNREEIIGDMGYVLWESKPWLLLATDTFVVRDGKILFQTFASYAGGEAS